MKKLYYLQLILLLLPRLIWAQTSTQVLASKFQKQTFKGENAEFDYRLFVPDMVSEDERLPLVITFHSAMTFGLDNESHIKRFRTAVAWSESDFQENNKCFIVAPQYPNAGSIKAVNADMRGLVDFLIDSYAIDKSRVYVAGTSSGAFSALRFTANNPDLVAAGIYMSGGSYKDWGDAEAKSLASIPSWFIHGEHDTIVKVNRTQAAVNSIEGAGAVFFRPECPKENCRDQEMAFASREDITHIYSELGTANHFYWDSYFDNNQIKEWLFRFSK